jgi:hypothetical protein
MEGGRSIRLLLQLLAGSLVEAKAKNPYFLWVYQHLIFQMLIKPPPHFLDEGVLRINAKLNLFGIDVIRWSDMFERFGNPCQLLLSAHAERRLW